MRQREETFPQKRRKVVGIIMIVIALGLILLATSRNVENFNPGADAKAVFNDLRAPTTSTSEEPPVDRHHYLVRERKILTERVTTKGAIIGEYKQDFANLSHKNYDIEARFADLSRDFELYGEEIENARSEIQAMRPTDGETRQHQADILSRLDRLHNAVMDYKNHNRAPKDTVSYLESCQYELRRVGDAM